MKEKIRTFIIHALGGVTESEYRASIKRVPPSVTMALYPPHRIDNKIVRPTTLLRVGRFPDVPIFRKGDYALAKDELVSMLLKSIEANTEFSEPRNIGFETIEIEAKVTVLPPGWDS